MNILLHINKYILRFSMLLLFAVGGVLCAQAQDDKIIVTGKIDFQTENDAFYEQFNIFKQVRIYVFTRKEYADAAYKKIKDNNSAKELTGDEDLYYSVVKADDSGKFEIEAPGDGFLIVAGDYGFMPLMKPVAQVSRGEVFMLKDTSTKNNQNQGELGTLVSDGHFDKGKIFDEDVEVIATRDKTATTPISKSTARGDTLIGSIKFTIPYRVSSNMRVVVQPIWSDRIDIADEKSDTIFSYGYAFYNDKKEYNFTQRRRMAFNLMNDSLYRYMHEYSSLRTYDDNGNCSNISFSPKEDTIFVNIIDRLWGHDPDCSHPYPFGGIVNVYDYNAKVHTYKYSNDGERSNPLKFLDFAFKAFIPNPEDFKETMADKAMDASAEIHLNFDNNSAEIKLDDSLNIRNLSTVHERFSEISESKSSANPITVIDLKIVGVASPEGNETDNKNLAKRRAQSLANVISNYLSGRDAQPRLNESDVAPWSALVDVLKNKGYEDQAAEIQEICDKYPNDRGSQAAKIRNLPYYGTLLRDSVLPMLRTVKYVATLRQKRQQRPHEVLENYRRNKTNVKSRADFWNLFNAINEDENAPKSELENAAKYALKITRIENNPEYKNEGYWAYAACIVASQYISRDTCDLDLLKPFLDLTLEKDSLGRLSVKKFDQIRRSIGGAGTDSITFMYTNSPLVAANQLIMLLKQTDASLKKDIPALESLLQSGPAQNNMQYKTLLAFSKCLRGGYKAGGGFTEAEAEEVRNFVAGTSVTNAVVINLAVDDDKHIRKAEELADQLPDNAVSDYLKAVIALKKAKKDKSLAINYLAKCFVRDIKKMPIASNDRDLILDTDEPGNRAITGALKLWQDTMRTIVTVEKKVIKPAQEDSAATDSLSAAEQAMPEEFEEEQPEYNEKHPFTWYIRALEMLGDKNESNDEEGKEALFKCFDMDKQYIQVLNVSLIKDNSIRNNKELKAKLKTFRNEYNQSKR